MPRTKNPAADAPTVEPPAMTGNGQAGVEARPADPTPEELAMIASPSAAQAAPTAEPPAGAAAAAAGVGAVGVWQSNKRIDMLWSINQNRNSWVGVQGVGWKKLSNASDSAIVALTALSGHARQLQSPVYYREEADGMIHEMYIW
jgi:hypothetical protein